MPNIFKKYVSRGGKYTYTLYRDENGFTFQEHERSRLTGGGSFGPKTEAEVIDYVTRYLEFYPAKMREEKEGK